MTNLDLIVLLILAIVFLSTVWCVLNVVLHTYKLEGFLSRILRSFRGSNAKTAEDGAEAEKTSETKKT